MRAGAVGLWRSVTGQLALDGGFVEADDPLAPYLYYRYARLAGLPGHVASSRGVSLDVYRIL